MFWDQFNSIQCSVDDLKMKLSSLNAENLNLINIMKDYIGSCVVISPKSI